MLTRSFRYSTPAFKIKSIYLDVKHVIPCAMVLMQIAMMGLDLKPGDEVITADLHLQQLLR
jgi:hypothetical protein